MDNLTLLQNMRDDIERPTDEYLARGREKLLAHIEASTRTGSHPATATVSGRGRRFSKRALGSLMAAAAAAVLAVTFVVGDVVGPPDSLRGATSEAAALLTQAADATIETSDPAVGEGEFLRVETTAVWGNYTPDGDYLSEETMTLYVPADRGDEWVLERSLRKPTVFFSEKTEQAALATYENMIAEAGSDGYTVRGSNGQFGYENNVSTTSMFPSVEDLAALPRDPQAMLEHIYAVTEGQGRSKDGQAFSYVADMLRTSVIPADLRSTLYKTVALVPGVTVLDDSVNLEGNTGTAFGRTESDGADRQEIIIDPQTGLLIGERTILLEATGEIPAGTISGSTAVQTTVVDDAP